MARIKSIAYLKADGTFSQKIPLGEEKVSVDSDVSLTSSNPVQNRVITPYLPKCISNVSPTLVEDYTNYEHPTGYPYRYTISVEGLDATYLAQLYPNQNTSDLGLFSCECQTIDNGIIIFGREQVQLSQIVFNTIVLTKCRFQ